MKGMLNIMENEKCIIELNKKDYDYLTELLNILYKDLLKFPKKMRTSKFYTLENLINSVFNK